MILSFRTDKSEKTLYTHIRLLQEEPGTAWSRYTLHLFDNALLHVYGKTTLFKLLNNNFCTFFRMFTEVNQSYVDNLNFSSFQCWAFAEFEFYPTVSKPQFSYFFYVMTSFLACLHRNEWNWLKYQPRHEKTCFWHLWPGKTQTGLRSHRS